MHCTQCGARVPDANFCPNCGASLRWESSWETSGVYTGGGGYVGGDVHAGRDFIGRDQNQTTIHDGSGMYLVTRSTGASRVLITIGALIAFVGFGIAGYAILDFMGQVFGAIESDTVTDPDFSTQKAWLPLGFGLFFGGLIIANIGLLMYRRRD